MIKSGFLAFLDGLGGRAVDEWLGREIPEGLSVLIPRGHSGEDPLAECLPRDLEDPWTRENRFGDPAIFISGSLLISRPGLPFLVISLTP
ncbi:hypothetical protein Pmani_012737 [Petrolisthes manimaculis]|uniref:Uncharacterized protein n=1 Tax=Petrolisthes manimaculis TaxID=1843537 RepID=A0AAE1PX83_9EUCA|nr:hypothetical protein Pmani_012737 [Petrolisthes manimaculis]